MDPAARERMVARFQLTLALFEFGVAMLRQRLQRTHPTASVADIDRMVTEWLQRRPGAAGGDSPGHVRAWPRQ